MKGVICQGINLNIVKTQTKLLFISISLDLVFQRDAYLCNLQETILLVFLADVRLWRRKLEN